MSRRRDMAPTVARKDSQLEVMARKLAKAQARERDLMRDLTTSRRETATALEQLRRAEQHYERARAEQERCHEARIARYQTVLATEPPAPPEVPIGQRIREWFKA
jgi:peptidoglycan hydrolase CwlO-like protein